ncbi:hypothetical protein AVEN_20901-1, partial [Araneus ventricosus]
MCNGGIPDRTLSACVAVLLYGLSSLIRKTRDDVERKFGERITAQ